MKLPRYAPLALALLIPAAAVVELVGNCRTAEIVPPDSSFAPAAGIVREGREEGDLVLFAPDWLNQSRLVLGEFIAVEDEARVDTFDRPRIWELALDGYQSPETEGLPVIRRWPLDRLNLTLYRNSLYGLATWRALDDYASAKVSVVLPDGEKECPWQAREKIHACGPAIGESWVKIEPIYINDISFRLRHCLWAHPTEKGALRIRFDDVPTGTRLTGGTGLAYAAYRDTNWQAPVFLDVEVDGRPLGRVVQRGDAAWTTFAWQVPAGPERRSVVFSVTTPSQGMRHFCFDASMRAEAPR